MSMNIFKRVRSRISLEEFLTRTPSSQNRGSLEWLVADHPSLLVGAAATAGAAFMYYFLPTFDNETPRIIDKFMSRQAQDIVALAGAAYASAVYFNRKVFSSITGIGHKSGNAGEALKNYISWYVPVLGTIALNTVAHG